MSEKEEQGYSPNYKVKREVKLNEIPPKNTQRLNRNAIIAILGIVGFFILFSFVGHEAPSAEKKVEMKKVVSPSEVSGSIPKTYEEFFSSRKRNKNTETFVYGNTLSEKEKFLKELEFEDLQAKVEALDGDLIVKMRKGTASDVRRVSYKNNNNGSATTIDSLGAFDGLQTDTRDSFNRQDDKLDFLDQERDSSYELDSVIQKPKSKNVILGGTVIPASLVQGVNSDLPKYVSGRVTQNVYDSIDHERILIPQGTLLIGEYDSRITFGQERILVVWNRLIFEEGDHINLRGMPGVDLGGYAGLSGEVDNHYDKLFTGVLLGSVIGASAQIAEGNTNALDPSFGQFATRGVSRNLNVVGQRFIQDVLSLQPTIAKEPGDLFNVLVTKDMYLPAR